MLDNSTLLGVTPSKSGGLTLNIHDFYTGAKTEHHYPNYLKNSHLNKIHNKMPVPIFKKSSAIEKKVVITQKVSVWKQLISAKILQTPNISINGQKIGINKVFLE